MDIRWYQSADHEMLDSWAKAHGVPQFAAEMYLPSYGKIAEEDGQPVAAIFVYDPGVPICMLNWPVTNPESPVKTRRKGLISLVEDILNNTNKGALVVAHPGSRSVQKIYEKLGFAMANEANKEKIWGPKNGN